MQQAERLRQLEAFIDCIWEASDLVELRRFGGPAGDGRRQAWMRAAKIPAAAPRLAELNELGDNVYAGVNPRTRHGGSTNDDVELFRCLFVDWDGIGPKTAARAIDGAGLVEPTVIVSSGHGVHAYWRLEQPIEDAGEWRDYQRALILALGSDPAVKDPARIMRLPGFLNVKAQPVPCSLLQAWPDHRPRLQEIGVEREELTDTLNDAILAAGGSSAEPHPRTLRFARAGAPEGERNTRAFEAACDLAARGFGQEQARDVLRPGARACGLAERELDRCIGSAFSKPREPVTHLGDLDTSWAAERLARGTEDQHERARRAGADFRAVVTNVLDQEVPARSSGDDDKKPKTKTIHVHLPLPTIRDSVKTAMGDWPRSAAGLLFAVDERGRHDLPRASDLRWLARKDELFAWLQERADVHWLGGRAIAPQTNGSQLSTVSREELFAGLRQWTADDHAYDSVELLPHEPPAPETFYVPARLPASDGSALDELVDHLNPESDIDRDLMRAMVVTGAWGGPCGARPAFVLTSPHGRGSGKTATAKLVGRVWGGSFDFDEREDLEIVRQRLLSDDALAKRVVLLDNLKSVLSLAGLEAMITAEAIQGKRLYHGGYTRPNRFLWLITANTPRLSQDLAQRSVVVRVGSPKHAGDFELWAERFMEARRAEVVADCLAFLRQPARCTISRGNRDRWALWQRAVLERFVNGNDLAAHVIASRSDVDLDTREAEDIAYVLDRMVDLAGYEPATTRAALLRSDVKEALAIEGLVSERDSDRKVVGFIRRQLDVEPLRGRLVEDAGRRYGRRWLWIGEDTDQDAAKAAIEMPAGWQSRWRDHGPGEEVITDLPT